MNIGLATLLTLMLLLPGIGFITGVNLRDKNVREVVFRSAPAEIGYVIAISMIVHLVFAATAWLSVEFNVGGMLAQYADLAREHIHPQPDTAGKLLFFALLYGLVTALVGFASGWTVGKAVRPGGKLEFLAKHKWMLQLIGGSESSYLYAQVLLTPYLPVEASASRKHGTSETSRTRKIQTAIKVEGIVSDPFFDSSGKLLYLVFREFQESIQPLDKSPVLDTDVVRPKPKTNGAASDQLVVEGDQVAYARYQRLPIDVLDDPDNMSRLEEAVPTP